jgi:NhaP-type Na+/H+ or K+/H+ antiporter
MVIAEACEPAPTAQAWASTGSGKPMQFNFETGWLLLLIAAVVAMLTRRLRLPYSVGLVVAGIALAILPFAPKLGLTKDLIFTVLLPPLLFEAALFKKPPEI